MKGGYKIIDFKNVSLSGTPVTMTDVLVDLLNNYEKVVLLSHVVLSGSAKDDCFSTVLSDGNGGVKLNCYDGYISISSAGAVTYTVASVSGMSVDIASLENGLSDVNSMLAPAWSASETYTKNSIVRDGGQLYKAKSNVPTGTATNNTTYWLPTTEAEIIKQCANNDEAVSLTITSANATITGNNTVVKKQNNVVIGCIDMTMTSPVEAWKGSLNLGMTFTSGFAIATNIFEVTNENNYVRIGRVSENGDLLLPFKLVNDRRYLITFQFII